MEQDIEIGQFWALPAQDGLPPLLAGIFSIEETEHAGTVIGVAIQPHPEAVNLGWPEVGHVPIAAESLGLEAGKLVQSGAPVPESFREGHGEWAKAFAAGKAGVFTGSVSETYGLVTGLVQV
ncbi:hypothetical protein J7443_08990 [Tropicibacter sp. R15_0]|uniref:hypothetical protein n=1 Tax=Tropicibacter sp. R15_0 TaxID=2821101 RepID=UPI001ADD4A2E|nr:hypothetical protein [Tropicibacter sp. R15_0]MBO9465361.1 hypothetical protein [Tropicibacter sp. R15_0]